MNDHQINVSNKLLHPIQFSSTRAIHEIRKKKKPTKLTWRNDTGQVKLFVTNDGHDTLM